jgi:hypothetical protein
MNIGDKVKVIATGIPFSGYTGEIIKISEVNKEFPYVVEMDGSVLAFKEDELKVIQES